MCFCPVSLRSCISSRDVTPCQRTVQGEKDDALDVRVKLKVHPGRMRYTTALSKDSVGMSPQWNDVFLVACPRGVQSLADYVPCLSFR